jgi:helicase
VSGPNAGVAGDLARAALLAVATNPTAFRPGVRQVDGVPYAAMYPILEEAPRYLHWLASQGLVGTVHPWCAIVAADLERRIRWRHLQPPRGAGRLLWICEQMATPAHLDEAVPQLWAAARERGHRGPDWQAAGRPRHCHLDHPGYRALLRERATGIAVEARNGLVQARGPAGSALAVWTGADHDVVPIRYGEATIAQPGTGVTDTGVAVFTWRGDYRGSGWLAAYAPR